MGKQLSAETIYVGLYVPPAARRGAHGDRTASGARHRPPGQISNMTSMAERSAKVASRTVPDHWEGDFIKGARNGSAVGTLVERATRLVILARMEWADAASARQGFTKKIWHVPALLRKTLTYDRGKERTEHERLAERFAIRVFFADPYSPWQRGTNENTNGCCASTCPRGQICRGTPSASRTRLPIG